MSAIAPVSHAPVSRPAPIKDADGDNDGTKVAAAKASSAPAPTATPLATSGLVGRNVNTKA